MNDTAMATCRPHELSEAIIRGGSRRRQADVSLGAADREGEVLDLVIQRRRDEHAAIRLMRKLLKRQGFAPTVIVSDKLKPYASAFRQLHDGSPKA
jgi:transposase-like protein